MHTFRVHLGLAVRFAAALLALNLSPAVPPGQAIVLAAPPPIPVAQPPAAPGLAPHPVGATVDPPTGCNFVYSNYETHPHQPIPDQGTITQTITVSGLPRSIWQVDLFTNISHTYAADLDIYLVAPSPQFALTTITTDNGGGNDNVFAGTYWADRYPLGVTEVTFANNVVKSTLVPEGAMGRFRETNHNGDWNLIVHDDAYTDTGTLNDWALYFTYLDALLARSESYATNNTDQAIPNPGTITSTINVSVPGDYLVDLYVQVGIPHYSSGDLSVVLKAPNGYTTTLTSGNGGDLNNLFVGTIFADDPAGGPVTDATYVNGVALPDAQPEGALGRFLSIDPNGPWQLIVTDAIGNGAAGAGVLDGWQLAITTGSCPHIYLPLVHDAP